MYSMMDLHRDGSMDEWVVELMGGLVNEWINEWMNRYNNKFIQKHQSHTN